MKDNFYILIILAMAGATLLVVLFILFQVRNRNRLLRQQKKMQEAELRHQKELLHAVIQSQEEERSRIGMDLHDEVGTVLSALRMSVEDGHDKTVIDRVMVSVRGIAHNLSPFSGGAYGLPDALEDLCEQAGRSGTLRVSLQCPPDDALIPLSHIAAMGLYRVIAELINNTIRHAKASHIFVVLGIKEQTLLVDYADDGVGMTGYSGGRGMGWRNIESRCGIMGAKLEVIGASVRREGVAGSKGLAVHLEIPLNAIPVL